MATLSYTLILLTCFWQDSILVLDMCSYNDMEGVLGQNVLGNFQDILTPEIRNNMEYLCDNIKRVEILLSQQRGPPISNQNLPVFDANGKSYRLDFLTVNPLYRQVKHCFVYGISHHAGGQDRYEDISLLKINTCLVEASSDLTSDSPPAVVDVLHQENVYLGEPVFVADPAGKHEDSGVLLMVTKRGETDSTVLTIVDASSFKIKATVVAPFPLMFEFHGQFFPTE